GLRRGPRYQAAAEGAFLHPLARAADVEVDLVVAVALAELRAEHQLMGIGPPELQRDRVLRRAECEMPLELAVNQRAGGDHLGVQPGARGHLAQEVAAVPVGPVHHWRDAEPVARLWWCYSHLLSSLLQHGKAQARPASVDRYAPQGIR